MARLLPATEPARSRTPAKQHVKTHQRRQAQRSYLLMLTVGVLISIKGARMATNATTRMYAAWTDAAGSTQPTSTHKPQVAPPAQGAVIPKTFPDVKGSPIPELPEWQNTARVPVPNITKCIETWEKELANDIDREFILTGIKEGFKLIDPEAKPAPSNTTNYKSASVTNKDAAEKQIYEEIRYGRYIIADRPPPIISSLGAIPKKNGDVRLIHDLSRPGGGVNQHASDTSVSYPTVEGATKTMNKGCYLAKIDLASAYRSIPLHPSSFQLTGLKWRFGNNSKNTFLFDSRLPFGAARSCRIFQALTDSIVRMMDKRDIKCRGYIDDFLIITDTYLECKTALSTMTTLIASLGLEINWSKVEGPSTCLTFLGVRIDTEGRTLALPEEKLRVVKETLQIWKTKQKAKKLDIQRLVGSLNWCARVIAGGRSFLRNIIDLIGKATSPYHYVRLGAAAKADINWWIKGLDLFNGFTPFPADVPEPTCSFATDACLSGGAGHFGADWFFTDWAIDFPELNNDNINVLELKCVLIAVKRWSHEWYGKHLVVHSDNASTVAAVNNATSRSQNLLPLVQELFWWTISNNFKLSASFIPGKLNILADRLSRLHEREAALEAQAMLNNFSDDKVLCKHHISYDAFLYLQDSWRQD
jgi:hypothetical protein